METDVNCFVCCGFHTLSKLEAERNGGNSRHFKNNL